MTLTAEQIADRVEQYTGRTNGLSLGAGITDMHEMLTIVARDTALNFDQTEPRDHDRILQSILGESIVPPELRGGLIGFQSLDQGFRKSYDIEPGIRNRAITMSRHMAITDPIISHAVRLYTDFGIGTGATVNTEGKRAAKKVLELIWKNPKFSRIFGKEAQRQNSKRLLTDGDFMIDIEGRRGSPDSIHFRRINPMEITKVITDPHNDDEVWGYERSFRLPAGIPLPSGFKITSSTVESKASKLSGGQLVREYIADWTGIKKPGDTVEVITSTGNLDKVRLQPDRRIVSLSMNTLGHRGNPMAMAAIPWATEFNRYMRARVTVARAVAAIAVKISVKDGTTGTTNRIGGLFNSSIRSRDDQRETNPLPGPGAFLAMSDKISMETANLNTGADSARTDSNLLVTMVGIGMGLFPHWLGFGDSFRLATARAMEPPMKKLFDGYQCGWVDFYKTVTLVVMDLQGVRTGSRNVDIRFPDIMKADAGAILEGLNRSLEKMPWLQMIPTINKRVFELLELDDPEGLWQLVQPEVQPLINELVANSVSGAAPDITGRKPDATQENNPAIPTEEDPDGERQG